MNIHAPERQPHESQSEYRARQRQSKDAARNARGPGDQRKQPSSREHLRDAMRKNGKRLGGYGRGLLNQFGRKQRDKSKHPLRDERGALTLTGRLTHFVFIESDNEYRQVTDRRVWVAGLSARQA